MLDKYSKCVADKLLKSLSVGVCQASNVVVSNFAVADRKIESPKVCVDIAVGNRNISKLLIFNAKGRTWLPNFVFIRIFYA